MKWRPFAPLILLSALLPLSVGLLASCATLAPTYAPADWTSVLPKGADLYVSVEVASSRQLLDQLGVAVGAKSGQVKAILQRTHRALAAVDIEAGGVQSFSLVAFGEFTPAGVSFGLNGNREWRRVLLAQAGGAASTAPSCSLWPYRTYWIHGAQEIPLPVELACPARGVVLLSSGGMVSLLRGLPALGPAFLPEEVLSQIPDTALLLYLPQLAGLSGSGAAPAGTLPVRSLLLTARVEQGGYDLRGSLALQETGNARVLSSLVRLMLLAWMREAGLSGVAERLRAVQVSVEEKEVGFSGLRLSASELSAIVKVLYGAGGGAES
jgi:hypothetical protein